MYEIDGDIQLVYMYTRGLTRWPRKKIWIFNTMKYLIFYYYFLFVQSFVLEDLWQNHIVFSEGGFRFDEIFSRQNGGHSFHANFGV